MGKVKSPMKMAGPTMDNSRMTRSMEKVYTNGPTEEYMMVTGKMEYITVKENLRIQKV